MSADILVVSPERQGGNTIIWCVEARDAAEHPGMHRTVCTTEHCLTPNVNSANTGKA